MAYQTSFGISAQERAAPQIGPFQHTQEQRYLRQNRLAQLGRNDNIVRVNHYISQIEFNGCGKCKNNMCSNNSPLDFVLEMETNFFLNVRKTLLCDPCFRSIQDLTLRQGCDNIFLDHDGIAMNSEQQRYQFALALISNDNMLHANPFPSELLFHYRFLNKQLNDISERGMESFPDPSEDL